MNILFNNKNRSGAFWGTIIGTSLGVVLSSRISPLSKKRVMKTARKVRTNLKDGMNNLWR